MEIPSFQDISENQVLDGDKVRIDEILNKEIIVTGAKISSSKYKDRGCGYCIKVQFYCAEDEKQIRKVFFSGSSVIKDQIEEVSAKFEIKGQPMLFKAVVKKVGNYYSFS